MKNIVILISGRGSNMSALVDACVAERWPARICAVISNRSDAAGLKWAQARGIPTQVLEHTAFSDRLRFDEALTQAIDAYEPNVVVLAGFMRILGAQFVARYAGRLINIHPSLLPAFPGLHTHARALEAGVQAHGATVHFVTPDLDHGPIIGQVVVPVDEEDTEASLAEKVLRQERILYPQCVRWVIEGRTEIRNGRVKVQGLASRLLGCL